MRHLRNQESHQGEPVPELPSVHEGEVLPEGAGPEETHEVVRGLKSTEEQREMRVKVCLKLPYLFTFVFGEGLFLPV